MFKICPHSSYVNLGALNLHEARLLGWIERAGFDEHASGVGGRGSVKR